MLYYEFLNGTGAPDNAHTYAEYKRIEKIYNADDRMEKSDAYAMYQKPDKLTAALLEEIFKLKEERSGLSCKLRNAEKQVEDMKSQIKKLESNRKWTAEYLEVLGRELRDALYTIEDKLGA